MTPQHGLHWRRFSSPYTLEFNNDETFWVASDLWIGGNHILFFSRKRNGTELFGTH